MAFEIKIDALKTNGNGIGIISRLRSDFTLIGLDIQNKTYKAVGSVSKPFENITIPYEIRILYLFIISLFRKQWWCCKKCTLRNIFVVNKTQTSDPIKRSFWYFQRVLKPNQYILYYMLFLKQLDEITLKLRKI